MCYSQTKVFPNSHGLMKVHAIVEINMINMIKSKGVLTGWTYFYDDLLTRLLEQ